MACFINQTVPQPTSSNIRVLFRLNFSLDPTTLTPALAISTHNQRFTVFAIFVVKEVPEISDSILKSFKPWLSFLALLSVRHLASLTTRNSGNDHVTSPFQGTESRTYFPGGREAGVLCSHNIILCSTACVGPLDKCLPKLGASNYTESRSTLRLFPTLNLRLGAFCTAFWFYFCNYVQS